MTDEQPHDGKTNCLIPTCRKPISKNSGYPAGATLVVEVPDVKLSDGSTAKWIQPLAVAKRTLRTRELREGKICGTCHQAIEAAANEEKKEAAQAKEDAELGVDGLEGLSPELAAALGDDDDD